MKYDWQNNLRFTKENTITLGVETQSDTASSSSIYGSYASIFPAKAVRTTSVYFQDQVSIDNAFFATAGMRYDKNQMFGGVTTFRIAPAYLINSKQIQKLKCLTERVLKPLPYSIYMILHIEIRTFNRGKVKGGCGNRTIF